MDTKKIASLVIDTTSSYLCDPEARASAEQAAKKYLPAEQLSNIGAVLASSSLSYRDALIIQLAYGLCERGKLDLTKRHSGARGATGVAGRVAAFLAESHIAGVRDAYQNIGKNTPNLVRGNFREFDEFLIWASEKGRGRRELKAAFDYACAAVAATARPVQKMPRLLASALTFSRMASLLDAMYDIGSAGAYEQFSVAAILHALVVQAGAAGFRVETKSLNASDRSSRVAGDVQILTGNRVVEAYEVTANDWSTKVGTASQVIRDNDLTRLHIIAKAEGSDWRELLKALGGLDVDVSVLDVRCFTRSLVSGLTRQHRAIALERLYEFLDRYQPDVNKVNRYVELLHSGGLVEPA